MHHYTGVLAEWIERRLEQVREMAAQLNDSESDVDREELSGDEDDDDADVGEYLIVVQLLTQLLTCDLSPSSDWHTVTYSAAYL